MKTYKNLIDDLNTQLQEETDRNQSLEKKLQEKVDKIKMYIQDKVNHITIKHEEIKHNSLKPIPDIAV